MEFVYTDRILDTFCNERGGMKELASRVRKNIMETNIIKVIFKTYGYCKMGTVR